MTRDWGDGRHGVSRGFHESRLNTYHVSIGLYIRSDRRDGLGHILVVLFFSTYFSLKLVYP